MYDLAMQGWRRYYRQRICRLLCVCFPHRSSPAPVLKVDVANNGVDFTLSQHCVSIRLPARFMSPWDYSLT